MELAESDRVWRRMAAGEPLTEEHCRYIFYGGGRLDDRKGDAIFIMDKPGNHAKQEYIVLYANGTMARRRGAR